MDKSEKVTFTFTLLLVVVIIASSLIIFLLTPSPITPTKYLFGYITRVYTNNKSVYIDFDSAQLLTDTDTKFQATAACVKDKKCPQCSAPVTKSCAPDGFYIRNPDPKNVSYQVVPIINVGTLIPNPNWVDSDPNSKPYKTISLSDFENIYFIPESPDAWITKEPFDVTSVAGEVIIINQHYFP